MIRDIIKKALLEARGEQPPKTPPKNIKKILDQIELFEVYPKIFALVIKDDKLRARVFLRYQEFYESDSDSFRGKGFKWKDYIDFYKEKTKKDYFSYHEDFAGYNVPCTSIESCMEKIPDLNVYDMIMFSIVDTIKSMVGSDDYYLIGIDQSNGDDPSLIYHEVAHGLWFSNQSYKLKMSKLINNLQPEVKLNMIKKLQGYGYGDNVYSDEIQAYLATGLASDMKWIRGIKEAIIPFKETFSKYTSKIKPVKKTINWSTDLDK
jgi:hypothetical protein